MFQKIDAFLKINGQLNSIIFFLGGGGVFAVFKLVQTPLRQSNRVTAMTDHELGLKLLLLLLDWLGTKSNVNGSVQHQSRFDAIYISKYIQQLQKMIDYKSIKQIVYVPFYTYFSIYEHLMIFFTNSVCHLVDGIYSSSFRHEPFPLLTFDCT